MARRPGLVHINLLAPEDLHRRISLAAATHRRSINAETLTLLELGFTYRAMLEGQRLFDLENSIHCVDPRTAPL